ncbi:hypothetical protein EV360DRAFT_90356 [Lentinula raphanica]|nr:hypothetical protein EV360DRAFT_90356 [Lentinula raphanica]
MTTPRGHFRDPLRVITTICNRYPITYQSFLQKVYCILCSWIIQNYAGKTYPEIYSSLIEIQLRKDVVNNNAGSQRIVSSTALATSSNDGRPGLIRCSNCHHRGHPKSKCWAPGGDKEHEAPPWYKPPASKRSNTVAAATVPSGSNIAPPVVLTNVIDLGSDTGGAAYSSSPSPTTADLASFRHRRKNSSILKDSYSNVDKDIVVPFPVIHVLVSSSTSPSHNSSSSTFSPTFLDSAASECCVRDRHLFTSLNARRGLGRMATEGENGAFQIEGIGVIEFSVRNSNGTVRRLRTAALYTPTFSMNLLSIPSFDAKGYVGSWGRGVLSVKDPTNGDVIIDGKLAQDKGSHKLYQVNIIEPSESHSSQSALATGISVHAGGNSL